MKKQAFTLIELIVVITILAILGTIAFISFKGFTGETRNAKVISDLNSLHKGFSLLKIDNGIFPMPDDSKIVIAGVGNTITYQGEVGDNLRGIVKADNNTKMPNGDNYEYAINGTKKKISLIGNLEDITAYSTTVSADSQNKLFKGDDVLVLYDTNNNFVADDILNPTNGGIKAYLGEKELSKTTSGIFPNSCKEIKDLGYGKANGNFKITVNGTETDVYCDMTFKGGGWTRLENDLATVSNDSGSVTLANGEFSGPNQWNGSVAKNSPIPKINIKYDNVKLDYSEVMFDLERTTTVIQCAYLYREANSGTILNRYFTSYEDAGKYIPSEGMCTTGIKKWIDGSVSIGPEQAKKWRTIWESTGDDIYFASTATSASDVGVFKSIIWIR